MKKILHILSAILLVSVAVSCATGSRNSMGGEVTGVGGTSWAEPTPYGMVLVSRGSVKMGPAKDDSLWNLRADQRGVSVDAFWMDETEITNAKYKQFVFWVRDSIIRERLADPSYGGNEEYNIEEDREGNPVTPHLNWNKAIPWRNANEDEQRAIESLYRINPITGVKELDPEQLNYRYEIYNHTEAAKRKNRLNAARREYNTDRPVPTELPLISKDTAFVNDDGEIISQTVTRALTGPYDFVNTYIVNVYPDTTAWINDFDNAYNEPYVRMYFSHGGYSDYPVVGVSWEQANAFANWRTTSCAARSDANASTSSLTASPPRLSGSMQPVPARARICIPGTATCRSPRTKVASMPTSSRRRATSCRTDSSSPRVWAPTPPTISASMTWPAT